MSANEFEERMIQLVNTITRRSPRVLCDNEDDDHLVVDLPASENKIIQLYQTRKVVRLMTEILIYSE